MAAGGSIRGSFGSFRTEKMHIGAKEERIATKRYTIKGIDTDTLWHAWTERYFLEGLTSLIEQEQATSPNTMNFLSSHVAKFHYAWVEKNKDGEDESLCLLIDLIQGRDLGTCLGGARGISEENTVKISCELLQTLTILHEIGISHRDLKLDNVMIDKEGTPILIDWGTACFGTIAERSMICGSRRANSIQQLAVEAYNDGKLDKEHKQIVFSNKKPSYNVRANDVVQFSHLLCGLWTSRSSNGLLCCGALGPHWDDVALDAPASELLPMLIGIYGNEVENSEFYKLIPDPFRAIVAKAIRAPEENRITLLKAWTHIRQHPVLIGPSGKKYDLRKYLPKPPSAKEFKMWNKKLGEFLKIHSATAPPINGSSPTPAFIRSWKSAEDDDETQDEYVRRALKRHTTSSTYAPSSAQSPSCAPSSSAGDDHIQPPPSKIGRWKNSFSSKENGENKQSGDNELSILSLRSAASSETAPATTTKRSLRRRDTAPM